MAKKTYAEIEKDLPLIVKAELQKQDDIHRELFAEEFGKKRKTLFHSYGYLILLSLHRWYITGSAWITLVQWLLIACGGIGLIWVFIDLFLIPGMRRDRNAEIAKSILAEHRILSGNSMAGSGQSASSMVVNVRG